MTVSKSPQDVETGRREKLMTQDRWKTYSLEEQIKLVHASKAPYREFLRVPALSCGVYTLPAGAEDLQAPHDEDEVYFVLEGRARLNVDGETIEAGPGTVLYVGATQDHSFFEIQEDITLLVFFATGGASGGTG